MLNINIIRNSAEDCAVLILRYLKDEDIIIKILNEVSDKDSFQWNYILGEIFSEVFDYNDLDMLDRFGSSKWTEYKEEVGDELKGLYLNEIRRSGYVIEKNKDEYDLYDSYKELMVGSERYLLNWMGRVLDADKKDLGFYDEENCIIQYNTFEIKQKKVVVEEEEEEEEDDEPVETEDCIIDGINYQKDDDHNIYDNEGESIGVYNFITQKWIKLYCD